MKVMTVTGYKPMELNIYQANDERIAIIKAAIKKRLLELMEEGLEWVITSGQMGVELWTTEICLQLKLEYDINIAMFPPFENQDKRWPEHIKAVYDELIHDVDFYKPLYIGDYKGAFQFKAKNKWFVDKSDGCLLLMDEENPGSNRFFYQEAIKQHDYSINLITPFDLEDIVESMRMDDPDNW